jgi:hypothetical protein
VYGLEIKAGERDRLSPAQIDCHVRMRIVSDWD